MQRTCRYVGAARGKAGSAAMHSSFAAVAYVTVTFDVNHTDMRWQRITQPEQELAHRTSKPSKPAADRSRPDKNYYRYMYRCGGFTVENDGQWAI